MNISVEQIAFVMLVLFAVLAIVLIAIAVKLSTIETRLCKIAKGNQDVVCASKRVEGICDSVSQRVKYISSVFKANRKAQKSGGQNKNYSNQNRKSSSTYKGKSYNRSKTSAKPRYSNGGSNYGRSDYKKNPSSSGSDFGSK